MRIHAGGNAVILECVSSTGVVFARHLLHNQMCLCAAETIRLEQEQSHTGQSLRQKGRETYF